VCRRYGQLDGHELRCWTPGQRQNLPVTSREGAESEDSDVGSSKIDRAVAAWSLKAD
jgi:hypothetical protein